MHRQKRSVVSRIRRRSYGEDWRELSRKIKKRDNYTCQKCGIHMSDLKETERLEVHHIRSLSRGGTNSPVNLHTLCSTCHAKEHKHLRR